MNLVFTFELIGTIAFAVSGALIAIDKHLDLFGIVFLSVTTSVGGGIFRDVIIGNVPPVAFIKPVYCIISLISAMFTCLFYKKIIKLKNVMLISDAIGLGIFTAIGSNTAVINNMDQSFLVISMGLITGIGGGILRDVFVKHIPFVFRKEIYAVASILGGLGYYFTYNYFSHSLSLYVCFLVTSVIRILSVAYNLNLPAFGTETGTKSVN